MSYGGTWWRSPGWPIPAWVHGNAPALSHTGLKVSEMLRPNVPPIEMRAPGPRTGLGFAVTSTGQVINGGGGDFYAASGGGPIITPSQSYYGGAPLPLSTGAAPTPGGGPATSPTVTPTPGAVIVNPIWYDTNNNIITSAVCGSVYNMTFPGWEGKSIYVIQTKNGAQQFAGSMPIPMLNYASKCNQDEGNYFLSGYDPTSGNLIGQGNFTVLPAGTASAAPSSTGTTGATTPTTAPATKATMPTTTAATMTTTTTPATTTSIFANLSTVDWILIAAVVIALVKK